MKTEVVYRAISAPSTASVLSLKLKVIPARLTPVHCRLGFSSRSVQNLMVTKTLANTGVESTPDSSKGLQRRLRLLTDYAWKHRTVKPEVSVDLFAWILLRPYRREAVLKALVEGRYNRTELPIRPALLTVLWWCHRCWRRLASCLRSPFVAVRLSLDDRQISPMGRKQRETSKATTVKPREQFIPEDRYKYQSGRPTRGVPLLAKVVNAQLQVRKGHRSGQCCCHDKPDIATRARPRCLSERKRKYTANSGMLNDEPISGGNAIVEWSTDGGKTYAQTGDSITLSSDEEPIPPGAGVRSPTASADDACL